MAEPIRILLVDDHFLLRAGLASILNLEEDLRVCGEADSAEEAITLLERYRDFERGQPGTEGIIVHDSEGEHRIEHKER